MIRRRRRRRLQIVEVIVVAGALVAGCAEVDHGASAAAPRSTSSSMPTLRTARWEDPTAGSGGSAATDLDVDGRGTVRLRLRWQVDGVGPMFGSPVLADGTLYIQTSSGASALDAGTGALRWRNDAVTGFAGLSLNGESLYSVSADATRVVKLDRTTGQEQWTTALPAQANAATFAPPRVVGGTVLVGESSSESLTAAEGFSFRGRMYGLDDETGGIAWQHFTTEIPHTGASVWTFPTIDEGAGIVYFGTSNNYTDPASGTSDSVFALDVVTGERRWSRQLLAGDVWAFATHGANGGFDYDVSTSPVLIDLDRPGRPPERLLVVAQKSGIVSALDRATGEMVWQQQVSSGGRQGGVLSNLAYDGERLLVVGNNGAVDGPLRPGVDDEWNGDEVVPRMFWPDGAVPTGTLTAIDPDDGEISWRRQVGAWSLSPVTVVDGLGFVAVGKGLEVFDPRDGQRLDRVSLPHESSSAVIGGGGTVFVGGSGGWNANGDEVLAFDVVAA